MSTEGRPTRRRRRVALWLRFVLGTILFIFLLATFGVWLLTRSWFIVERVEPVLSRLLGGQVTVESARYRGEGRITFHEVRLVAPGLPGDAAELLRIGDATVRINMAELIRGRVRFDDVELTGALVRVSEDGDTPGLFSFMSLDRRRTLPTGNLPPRVVIKDARVEMGVHQLSVGGGTYRKLGERAFTGFLRPSAEHPGRYDLSLRELNPAAGAANILVTGEWDAITSEHTIEATDFELNEQAYAMCPEIARRWWDRMNLEGRVATARTSWSKEKGLQLTFDVEDVGLTIPIEVEGLWARYRGGGIDPSTSRPRMRVDGGTILLSADRVTLSDLRGELVSAEGEVGVVGVPYHVDLDIGPLPALEWSDREAWMDEALRTAPFRMSFRSEGFHLAGAAGESPAAVELPAGVARVLERFRLTEWVMSTWIDVERGEPALGADGSRTPAEFKSSGRAYIADAAGRFEQFPYPLHEIRAYLEFDDERVNLHYLTGTGSRGATVRLDGTIAPPRPGAAVDLHIVAQDLPIDEELRGALDGDQTRLYDALLHGGSFERLQQAGLLAGDERVASAEAERREAVAEQRRLLELGAAEDAARLAALGARIDRLDREIAAGPFALGGTVDLELSIERPFGPEERTSTSGSFEVHDLGLVYERFPYPITITSGRVEWTGTSLNVPDEAPLSLVTAGGGIGELTGRIEIVPHEGGSRVRPDLRLSIRGDRAAKTLFAAIPPGAESGPVEGWPGAQLARAGEWLERLSARGELDYTARLSADDDGSIGWEIDVALREGEADLGPLIAHLLGREAAEEWTLTACGGRAIADRSGVRLEGLTGRCAGGVVSLNGRFETGGGPQLAEFELRIDRMELRETLARLVPPGASERMLETWERYAPKGTFDALVRGSRADDGTLALDVVVRPRRVEIEIGGEIVVLTSEQGGVRVAEGRLDFDDLAIDVAFAGEPAGRIVLGGSMSLGGGAGGDPVGERAAERSVTIEGSWRGGRFETPLIAEALERFGGNGRVGRYADLRPRGLFDATFRYARVGDGAHDYDIRVEPKSASVVYREVAIAVEECSGALRLTPGHLDVDELRGTHPTGDFHIDGAVHTQPALDARLRLEATARLMSPEVRAILPQGIVRVLDAIELEESASSRLTETIVVVTAAPGGKGASAGKRVELRGRLETQGAAFTAGVEFSDVHGPFEFFVRRLPEWPLRVAIVAHPVRAQVLGQTLTDIEAELVVSPDGRAVELERLCAAARDGAVTARATIGIGSNREWDVAVRMTNVPIGEFLLAPPGSEAHESKLAADAASATGASGGVGLSKPSGGVYGSLDLSGRRGDNAARVGRGVVRLMGESLTAMPLALRVLQIFHMTLPGGAPNFADASFFIAGDKLVFERLLFESSANGMFLQTLHGRGELDLETLNLDTRFTSRGGVLIVRDIVGGIGDSLAAIVVTGPLWDPRAQLIPLPPPVGLGTDEIGAAPVIEIEPRAEASEDSAAAPELAQ